MGVYEAEAQAQVGFSTKFKKLRTVYKTSAGLTGRNTDKRLGNKKKGGVGGGGRS